MIPEVHLREHIHFAVAIGNWGLFVRFHYSYLIRVRHLLFKHQVTPGFPAAHTSKCSANKRNVKIPFSFRGFQCRTNRRWKTWGEKKAQHGRLPWSAIHQRVNKWRFLVLSLLQNVSNLQRWCHGIFVGCSANRLVGLHEFTVLDTSKRDFQFVRCLHVFYIHIRFFRADSN